MASVTPSPKSGEAPLTVTFNCYWSYGMGPPYYVYISFGDGGEDYKEVSTTSTTFKHLYTDPGTYTVDLYVYDYYGVLQHAETTVEVKQPVKRYTVRIRVAAGRGAICADSKCNSASSWYSFQVVEGTSLTFNVTPSKDYVFDKLFINGSRYTPPVTIHVYEDIEAEAYFKEKPKHTVTLEVCSGSGKLCADGRCTRSKTSFEVDDGTELTITVDPDNRYELDKLYIDGSRYTPPVTITVDRSLYIRAYFKKKPVIPAPSIVSFNVWRTDDLSVKARVEWSGGKYPVKVSVWWGEDYKHDEITIDDPDIRSVEFPHTYGDYGRYVLTAEVLDDLNRSDSREAEIELRPSTVDLVSWRVEPIGDRKVKVSCEFSSEIVDVTWKWGDGKQDSYCPVPPSKVVEYEHEYPTGGWYHFGIWVQDKYGNSAEFSFDIMVPGTLASETFHVAEAVVAMVSAIIPIGTENVISVELNEAGEAVIVIMNTAKRQVVDHFSVNVLREWLYVWRDIGSRIKDVLINKLGYSLEEWRSIAADVEAQIKDVIESASNLAEATATESTEGAVSAARSLTRRLADFAKTALGGLSGIGGALLSILSWFAGFLPFITAAYVIYHVWGDHVEKSFRIRLKVKNFEVVNPRLSIMVNDVPLTYDLHFYQLSPPVKFTINGKEITCNAVKDVLLGDLEPGEYTIEFWKPLWMWKSWKQYKIDVELHIDGYRTPTGEVIPWPQTYSASKTLTPPY